MADRLALLEARLDYTAAQIEAMAQAREGLHGSTRLPPTSGQIIRKERQQAQQKAAASKGGIGPSKGKPCGRGHIAADLTCRKGAGQMAASVPSAGSSQPEPDRRPTPSQAKRLDDFLNIWTRGGSDFTKPRRKEILDYARERGLSDWELSAVIQYTRFGYRDVNAALRGLEPNRHPDMKPEEALVHAELIRTALAKLPEVNQPVWRGVSMDAEHLAEFKVGAIGADKGFQSTTPESPFGSVGYDGVAVSFASGELDVSRAHQVVFQYDQGHGARSIAPVAANNEQEALVLPGQRFRVAEVKPFADEQERRGLTREDWAETMTFIRLEPAQGRLDSLERRLFRLLHRHGGIGGADHLHAGRLQPGEDLAHAAATAGGSVQIARQDHAVAESVGGVGHGGVRSDDQATAGLDNLEARLARLDARVKQAPGQLGLDLSSKGKPCGESHIAADLTCHKGAGETVQTVHPLVQATVERRQAKAEAAAAESPAPAPQGLQIGLPDLAEGKTPPLLEGRPPQKGLGGGAYGDTYLYQLADGRQVVVKVDRLNNRDPRARDFDADPEVERRDMVGAELEAMTRAHQLGLAPRPLSSVQKLPDGRLAFAYEFVDGTKVWKDHRSTTLAGEAFELLQQPGMRAKVAAEVGRMARAMADSGFEHGDGHGGNVILGADGRVTLIDWGYADQRNVVSAAQRANIEMRQAELLGNSNMLGVNGPIDMRGGRGGVKDAIDRAGGPIAHFQRLARDAMGAEQQVLADYNRAWHADPANDLGREGASKAIRAAAGLMREKGISFEEAEIELGLEPRIPPEVKAQAAAARDAIFGERQLRVVRRMLDTHYQAWNDFAPWEEPA